jgi:hypothetical protein
MFVTLVCVILIVGRYLANPTPEFDNGLTGIAVVLGIPNAILTAAYSTRRIFQEQRGGKNDGAGEGDQ